MVTEFQKRKLSRQFQVYDVNADGFITKEDFERVFEALVQQRGWSAGTGQYEAFRQRYLGSWEYLQKFADSSRDGKVSLDEWLASRSGMAGGKGVPPELFNAVTSLTMEVFDADGDGRITGEDYAKVVAAHGGSASEAAAAFKKLDLNQDGEILADELRELVRQFYSSDDEAAPGNWLYGEV